uniref:Uncharacterized protein n=1 Tax=Molossus molossus TaxID=27622 RepID=A0A7J8BYI6_MOLMO|nr:hypothetical protein HJG59_010057 [Molossus molossus]
MGIYNSVWPTRVGFGEGIRAQKGTSQPRTPGGRGLEPKREGWPGRACIPIRSPGRPGKSVSPALSTVSENVQLRSAQTHGARIAILTSSPGKTRSCWKSAGLDVSGARQSCGHEGSPSRRTEFLPLYPGCKHVEAQDAHSAPTDASEPGPRGLCVYAQLPDPAGLPLAEV